MNWKNLRDEGEKGKKKSFDVSRVSRSDQKTITRRIKIFVKFFEISFLFSTGWTIPIKYVTSRQKDKIKLDWFLANYSCGNNSTRNEFFIPNFLTLRSKFQWNYRWEDRWIGSKWITILSVITSWITRKMLGIRSANCYQRII